MGKTTTTLINRFDGGVSNDKRSNISNKCSHSENFDMFTFENKIVPKFGSSAKETKAYSIKKFLYATRSGSDVLFGFGVSTGALAAVYYWSGSAWLEYTNNTSSTGARSEDVFFHYKGFIYMFGGGNSLKRFDVTSAAAFDDAYQSITYSTVVQPVHFPNDDCAYFFANEKIYRLDNVTWDGEVQTVPSGMKIVSACPYGNYLAIGAVENTTYGVKSHIFFWDRDSSTTTFSSRIDLGEGILKHISNLEGKLICVINNIKKITVIECNLENYTVLKELSTGKASGASITLPSTSQVINGKLYFPMGISGDLLAETRLGIWVLDSLGKLAIDFKISDATSYNGIYFDNYNWWIAHSNDGSVDMEDSSVSGTAIYESLLFGDSYRNKELKAVGLMFEPISSSTFTLKYRLKTTDSWTTIFTHNTTDSLYHEAINIEATGALLPQFREIQFQITVVGKTALTGLVFKQEEVEDNLTI